MNLKNQEKNTLLKLVRKAMKEKGWSIIDLEQKAKLPKGKASKFLSGHKGTPTRQFGLDNIYKILSTLGLLADLDVEKTKSINGFISPGEFKSSISDDILKDLQFEKEEKPDSETINARVGKAVEQLTRILLSGDANITRALLTALDSFVFYQKKSQAMKSQLENTDNTIKEVKKILQENLPPDGVEERRECWIKIKELLT